MSSNVLTHEELAALREESQRGSNTQDLDLTNSDRTQRKSLAQFEKTLSRLAPAVQAALGRTLRVLCDAKPTPPELVGATTIRHILDRNATTVPLHVGDICIGWLCLPGELCFCLVERSFGGTLPSAPEEDDEEEGNAGWRPTRVTLTPLEKRTVWPILETLVSTGLSDAFCDTDTPVTLGATAADPEPEFPELEEALAGGLDLEISGLKYRLDLVLLSSMDVKGTNDSKPEGRISLRAHVERAHVEISSQLGNAELTVRELLALQPGDVLRLNRNQSELLPLFVEAIPKFMARPLQRKGCFALQIETEVP